MCSGQKPEDGAGAEPAPAPHIDDADYALFQAIWGDMLKNEGPHRFNPIPKQPYVCGECGASPSNPIHRMTPQQTLGL